MSVLQELHMEMVDAVNNAQTKEEHCDNELKLSAWLKGVVDAGGRISYLYPDQVQIERGNEDRPMCCGVFLDWSEPIKTPRFPYTECSHCGGRFGPGDHGYSHCESHEGLRRTA